MNRDVLMLLSILLISYQNSHAQAEQQSKSGKNNNKEVASKNVISTGQDFNTTRSNRERSNFIIINIGDNHSGRNDSTLVRQEAKDFNTTRNNRERGNAIIINIGDNHPGNNDSMPVRYETKDFDTTGKLRKAPIESYNPWEMDEITEGTVLNPLFESSGNGNIKEKVIQVGDLVTIIIRNTSSYTQNLSRGDNPMYQAKGARGDNPLYQTKSTKGDNPIFEPSQVPANGNTNNDHANANSTLVIRKETQEYNSTSNNKCNALSINSGISGKAGDNTGNGWQIGADITMPLLRNLKFAIGINYSSVKFKYQGSSYLPGEYLAEMENSIVSANWHLTTINAGPMFRIGKHRLNADLYGKVGASFVKIPDQFIGIPGNSGKVDNASGIAKFSGNKTTASVQLGITINYAITRNADIFLNPHFFSTLGKNISYQEKDAYKALADNNVFDYKTFSALPYTKKSENIQIPGLSAGLRIYFCR